MANKLQLIITTDSTGAITGIKGLGRELKNIETDTKAASSNMSAALMSVKDAWLQIRQAVVAYGIYKGVKEFADAGIEYNKTLETSKLGIAAIYASMSTITDTQGRILQGQEKFNTAQALALDAQRELQKIAMGTPATYQELIEVYQGIVAPAMSAKMTFQEILDTTGLITNAVKAIGLPINQIKQEARDLIQGGISAASSSLATALDISNEMVKKWREKGTVAKELKERLEGFVIASERFADTWEGAWSNAKDIYSQMAGKAMEPLFEAVKADLREIVDKIVTIDETTKKITWNKDFLEGIEKVKSVVSAVIADVRRLAMLLDKAGGTLTMIGYIQARRHRETVSGLSVPDEIKAIQKGDLNALKAGGISDEEKWWKQQNDMFRERYMSGDKALMDMAMKAENYKPASAKQIDMLDWATPQAAGLTKVTTELGQTLYYVKEINKETGKAAPSGKKDTTGNKSASGGSAADAWARTIRDLQTEIEKTLHPLDEFDKKLLDIDNKYQDLIARANKGKFSTDSIEQWKTVMTSHIQWERQYGEYEESLKKKESATKEYHAFLDEMATSGENEEINRINRSVQEETARTKKLQSIWVAGAMSYEEYQRLMTMSEQRGERERQKIAEEEAYTRAALQRQIALTRLDTAEKQMTMPKADIISDRISIYQAQIEETTRQWQRAFEKGDTTAILTAEKQLEELRAKVVDLNQAWKEQAGSFGEGFRYGAQKYLYNLESGFEKGVKIAETTAKSMEDNFLNFCDTTSDKFGDWGEMIKSILGDIQREMLRMLIVKSLAGNIMGGLGSLSGLFGSSAGAGVAAMGAESFSAEAINSMVWLHTGGVPAYDVLPSGKAPASLFYNAPRYHSGVGPGEKAAIIREDEGVFTPGQMKALGAAMGNSYTISVPIYMNGEGVSDKFAARLQRGIEKEVRRQLKEAS